MSRIGNQEGCSVCGKALLQCSCLHSYWRKSELLRHQPTPEQAAFEAGWRAAVRNHKALTIEAAYTKWKAGGAK